MDGHKEFVMGWWLEESGLEVRTQIVRPWRLVRQSEIDSAVQHGSSCVPCSGIPHRRQDAHTATGNRQRGINRRAGHWDRETLVARLERNVKRAVLLSSP